MPFSISELLSSRETEGFSPMVDIGQRIITVLIWKKPCINLFITYFNIELKRIKLTSHIDTKLMDLRDNSPNMETPTNVSSLGTDLFQTTIDSWAEVTSWDSREAWYRVISVSVFCPDICPCDDISMALPVFTYGQNWLYY